MFANRQVIFEFFPRGQYVKVTAMDVATMTEISVQGAISAPEDVLKHNALRRLEYVLRRDGLL